MADALCFARKSVLDVFTRNQDPVRGNEEMQRLPNIGAHFQGRLAGQNMATINQFLGQAAQFNGATALMRFCVDSMENPRHNQCVVDGTSGNEHYHAADGNVCAYNTLIKLIRFANDHRNDWANFGFSQSFPCAFAAQLRLRTRGTNQGSRHCVCHSTQGDCARFPNACRWIAGQNVCVPRGGGDEGAGFAGKIMANNHRRAQRKRNWNGQRMGRRYVQGWMVNNQVQAPPAGPPIGPPPGPPPGPPVGPPPGPPAPPMPPPPPRRGARARRPSSRYPADQYQLGGGGTGAGGIKDMVEEWESMTEKQSNELRRFHNFLLLTQGF